jgi:hypothetical protein
MDKSSSVVERGLIRGEGKVGCKGPDVEVFGVSVRGLFDERGGF